MIRMNMVCTDIAQLNKHSRMQKFLFSEAECPSPSVSPSDCSRASAAPPVSGGKPWTDTHDFHQNVHSSRILSHFVRSFLHKIVSVPQNPHLDTYLLHQLLRARRPDEAVDVDVDEGGHEELAVEPVHDAAVPRNYVSKILNNMKHSWFELFKVEIPT